MGTYQTTYSARTAKAKGRSAQSERSSLLDWHLVYSQDRHTLGVSATGDGLWQWHDLLAPTARLANRRRLAENMAGSAGRTGHGRRNRLVYFRHGQLLSAGAFWGAKTGPNPTDRGKNGSKRHLIVDGQGTPLAIEHTGANVHDSEMAIALVDGIPPIKQPRGRPRHSCRTSQATSGFQEQGTSGQKIEMQALSQLQTSTASRIVHSNC